MAEQHRVDRTQVVHGECRSRPFLQHNACRVVIARLIKCRIREQTQAKAFDKNGRPANQSQVGFEISNASTRTKSNLIANLEISQRDSSVQPATTQQQPRILHSCLGQPFVLWMVVAIFPAVPGVRDPTVWRLLLVEWRDRRMTCLPALLRFGLCYSPSKLTPL